MPRVTRRRRWPGILLGFHRTDLDFESQLVAGGLLVGAGADVSKLRDWMKVGTLRAFRGHYSPTRTS